MNYVLENNVLMTYIDEGATSITLPPETVAISGDVFRGNDTIESVMIPEGVKKIGSAAFAYCHHLKTITLPSTLEEIGDGAFVECHQLTSLTIPESVNYMSRCLPTMVPIHLSRHGRTTTITLKDKDFYLNSNFVAGRDNDYFHNLAVYSDGELREIFDLIKDMDYRVPAALMLWDLEQDDYYRAFIKRNTIRSFRYTMDTHDWTHFKELLSYLDDHNQTNVLNYAKRTHNEEALKILESYLEGKETVND